MVGPAAWGLIFGGCCSNVFTLESIVKHEPDSGLLITVTQFILTTIFALPSQLHKPSYAANSIVPWRLKPTSIPLERLSWMALMFFSVNMLNNWAFAFNISVPMHIILRSFGSVQTLAVGYFMGKRYSRVQVGAVGVLTVGVIVSAWADAQAKGAKISLASTLNPMTSSTKASTDASASYATGLLLLFTAQLISAYMGVYTEATYAQHGRHWREILFYSHFLGLFFSLAFLRTILAQFHRLLAGPPASFLAITRYLPVSLFESLNLAGAGGTVSKSAVLLLLNGVTQVACISGVNLLSAQTNAVTVTVVLNVRKLVSFLLSCVIFGNPVGGLMAFGASLVFASGAVYGWDETRGKTAKGKGSKGKSESEASSEDVAKVEDKARNGTVMDGKGKTA